ncbi:MAG: hypothetical protein JSU08_15500 [Acidobacteria bacterium]|nr:hypothetical protein [Acidobacteriota bacterium]
MLRRILTAIACWALLAAAAHAQMRPTLTIVNMSSDEATVKVVGPSGGLVQVAPGGRQAVSVSGGLYELRIRYCRRDGCRYTRTDSFVITETPTSVSRTTITLHSAAGNLGESPMAPSDF